MKKNEKVVKAWKLRQNEKWDTIFRSKTRDGPILLMDCQPCLKFHVKGVCYNDCAFVKSHVELTDTDKEATASFIKGLRGE